VQQKIDSKGGSIAFIDDYIAWVTSPLVEANLIRIQQIVDRAVQWEKRSGTTFKSTKTALVHFTRTASRLGYALVIVKGKTIAPAPIAKVLGVVLDLGLWYGNHIARTATKGLKAALALKRLKMLSPSTA
jgi:hypothetical protein